MLAWGIVPVASDILRQETAKSLIRKLESGVEGLVQQGIDEETIAESSWVLPSCDTTLLSPEEADRALKLTSEISLAMKEKYGFNN